MNTKLPIAAGLILLGLVACSPKPTGDTSVTSESPAVAMSDMSGAAIMSGMSGMAMDMDTSAKKGTGVGVITAIDKTANTVTIKHDAIPDIGWPAMTMEFKANPASLLTGLKVGEKVSFDVSVDGSDAEVTSVRTQ